MRIKRIYLKNIRSYEEGEVVLPEGSVLFSGDIGSGKTSVLLAIEFALFGLEKGNLSGSSLLRADKNSGEVRVEIEIGSKDVVIERVLKRSKNSVVQDTGCIIIDNEKFELTPTQLKQKILELLNYPPDYLTKTNLLYRYTIYTPQESMREILLEKAELRVDTLRRIFGIDKYKTVQQNVNIFASKLRESIKNKEGMTIDLDSKKQELEKDEKEFERLKKEVEVAKKELDSWQLMLKEKKLLQTEIERRVVELSELKTEIAAKKSELEAGKEHLNDVREDEKILSKQLSYLKEEAKNFKFKDFEQEIKEKEKLLAELDSKRIAFEKEISASNHEKRQHEDVKISLSEIDVCPLCRQNVPHQHKLNILTKANIEIEKLDSKINEKLAQKELLEKDIAKQRQNVAKLQESAKEQIVFKTKLNRIEEKEEELKKTAEELKKFDKKISVLEEQLNELMRKMKEFAKFEGDYEKSKIEIEKVQEQEKQAAIKKAQLEKEIENVMQDITLLKKEIKEKEKVKADLEYLNKLRKWLQDKFTVVLSAIEQAVMAKLHADFSLLFQKWFSVLVLELAVRLDENFTPVIESRGHEIDYSFLSGGERTAAALAYRLALNQVINSFISKIKTSDILILDEPTDGFSSEQLDKMQDVLAELKVKQLILVSHEAKIESFVENIIRFRKEEGRTAVQG